MENSEPRALLLWDGECALCRKCVEWIERRDAGGRIRPVPYQEAPSPPMTVDLRRRCERALHLIPPGGEPVAAGKAALGVLSLLGWKKTAAFLSAAPMRWAVEAGYRLIARHRFFIGKFFAGK